MSAASTAVLTGSCKEKSQAGLTFLEAGEAGVLSSGSGDAAAVLTMNLSNSVEKPELLKYEPSPPLLKPRTLWPVIVTTNESIFGRTALHGARRQFMVCLQSC